MIVAFTGAGISKESGISTFQDRPGLRAKLVRSWANSHKSAYSKIIQEFIDVCSAASPNDAHISLAEYKVPVITMNVDALHDRAGSEGVIHLHGVLPNIVLYEDSAPNYEKGYNLLDLMRTGDIFLVVGASQYTTISIQLRIFAQSRGAEIVEIQDNAGVLVRKFLEKNISKIETLEEIYKRIDTPEYLE